MNSYAQSQEDLFIINYFGDYKGTLLDIGANDGRTFSNSKLMIENGWSAHLLEPGSIFTELQLCHATNHNVNCYNYGLGKHDEVVHFWESDAHVLNGSDRGLVSTCNFEETKRWPNVKFTKRKVQLCSWATFAGLRLKFDFISIDVEGHEWEILQQIPLDEVGCKCLCIEWNSNPELLKLFSDYCKGFRVGLQNAENLIFVK